MQNLILRWTLGPVSVNGRKILKESIYRAYKIWGADARYVVCYNGCRPPQLPDYTETYEQSWDEQPIREHGITAMMWKWSPPRLDISAHEIFLDNDVVILNNTPEIEDALCNNKIVIGGGWRRCYGAYDSVVDGEFKTCAGFVILPPNYDIGAKIANYRSKTTHLRFNHPWDEQGLITKILLDDGASVLSANTISNLPISKKMLERFGVHNFKFAKDQAGYHFVGANSSEYHYYLNEYWKFKSSVDHV
tara:strand:- start:6795 stop:7538 length:744 start_codon:yes stop_codon:yes gene_type:complete